MNLFIFSPLLIIIIISAPISINSAKILGIFMMPAYSQFSLGIRLMKELASKGHEVTFISPFPQNTPVKNLRDISVAELRTENEAITANFYSEESSSFVWNVYMVSELGLSFTEKILKNPEVQDLLKSNEKFDLVLMEHFWNDAFMSLATHFNCPLVMVFSMPASSWINHLVGNPGPSSYIPNLLSQFTAKMTFLERLQNTLMNHFETLLLELFVLPKHRNLARKLIPSAPNLDDILYNTSIFLINSHTSMFSEIPHVPKMIEIGGYHISPNKPLPSDLQSFLDSSEEGVILFAMGSNLKSSDMPLEKQQAILKAFSKIKANVLWKFETDLTDIPPNVKIQQWLPQQDVLAHENVKAFVTHGGLLSTTEAIYYGKPIIGIPIFGDQKMNINTAVSNGYAISISYNNLEEETLLQAMNEILKDKKYWNEAQRRSKLMHDRPVNPIDTAIYWIEYVIRHKGAAHLQSAALYLKWYQVCLLDVYGFIIFVCLVSCYSLVKLLQLSKSKKNSKDKNLSKKIK